MYLSEKFQSGGIKMLEFKGNYQLFTHDKKNIILSLYHDEITQIDKEPEKHQHMEIFFVVEGKGQLEINGRITFLSEGDVVVIDSMMPHRICGIDRSSSFVVMALMFDITAFIRDEFKVFRKKELDRFFNKISTSCFKINGKTKISSKVQNILFDIEDEFLDTEDNNVIRSFLILLLSYLVQYSNDQCENGKLLNKTPHGAEIEKAMIYIKQNINQNLTLDELARIANMNKTYFSTIFKKVTGLTVWEYILNARIELAISYLEKNNDEFNITEILSMCGFNNATSFNKTFKKITGKTPTEYKNSNYNPCF